MRIINLKDTVFRPGEYIVGAEQTHSHACYLVYGFLKAQENRTLSPGFGHEEIFCLLEGEARVKADGGKTTVQKGQCFHLKEEESAEISNLGEGAVVYVLAGGHSGSGHHKESVHQGEHNHNN